MADCHGWKCGAIGDVEIKNTLAIVFLRQIISFVTVTSLHGQLFDTVGTR